MKQGIYMPPGSKTHTQEIAVEVSCIIAGRIITYQYSHMQIAVEGDNVPEQLKQPGEVWQIVLEGGFVVTSDYNAFPDLLRWDADPVDYQWVALHVHIGPQGAILDPIEEQEWSK